MDGRQDDGPVRPDPTGVGSDVLSAGSRGRLTLRAVACGALGVLLVAGAVFVYGVDSSSMAWSLTPNGWVVYDWILIVLVGVVAAMLALRPVWWLILALLAFLYVGSLLVPFASVSGPDRWATWTLVLAVAELVVAGLMAIWRSLGRNRDRVFAVALALAVIALCITSVMGLWMANAFSVDFTQPSPDGRWTLTETSEGYGVLSEMSATFRVIHDVGGLFRQERVIGTSEIDVPDARWRDARTVEIGSKSVTVDSGFYAHVYGEPF